MLQRLFQLITRKPELLVDHAAAYSDLLAAESRAAYDSGRRLALLYALALCCAVVAAVLAGVALMLWGAVPGIPERAAWVLVGVPLAPALGAAGCLVAARSHPEAVAFCELRAQLQADLALLREAAAR